MSVGTKDDVGLKSTQFDCRRGNIYISGLNNNRQSQTFIGEGDETIACLGTKILLRLQAV